jgi:hypothetical protein
MGFFSTFDIWMVLAGLAVVVAVVLGGVSLLLRSAQRRSQHALPAAVDGGELVRLHEPAADRHVGAQAQGARR